MQAQIDQFIRNIQEKLPRHDSPESAAAEITAEMTALGFTVSDQIKQNLSAAIEEVKARLGPIEILRRNSIIKPRENWYAGPSPRDLHWPAVQGFLKNSKGWDHKSIASIDNSSTEVVSLLANPQKEQFRCRGLVVGYVQSGKTANMTAVIAKAVDAGYNLVVLLAGTTNKLRAQTQARIESDVVRRHRHQWQLYTTNEDDGDFTDPANRMFTMPRAGVAQLAVMKKETNRLEAFRRTIGSTPRAVLSRLKVLLIDDECDQASVNAAAREFDITKINEHIRQIIRALPGISYVGYTATPFANVFIDPFPHNKLELDDLYPEDFITALPRPRNYFGAREVFGHDPDDAGAESDAEAGRNMIRIIEDDLDLYRPARPKDKDLFEPVMGEDLRDAILWFLATCAIRRSRGHADKHMTMLVHTSPNIAPHVRTARLIEDWTGSHGADIRRGVGAAYGRIVGLVSEEAAAVPPSAPFPTGPRLMEFLSDALDALEVVVENSESEERLDFTGAPKTYIVVGGSVLARGLTLEGLSVSFFLRTSRQYDTLLQMGRWFGYRDGYEDLPRLWTTSSLAADFRALARIEEEIRDEIAVYRERKSTPLEFAVKVRAIPGMAITAASKMRHVYRTSISFDGKHIQTIRFDHQDPDVVAGNWKAGSELINEAVQHGKRAAETSLFTDVPFATVRRFLRNYRICDAHMDLKEDMLLGYVDGAEDKLRSWHVGVVSPAGGVASERDLGQLGRVATVKRARLAQTGTPYADIKALMSKRDILIDAAEQKVEADEGWSDLKKRRPAVPLLLLYPINRESAPREGSKTREALDAVADVLGFGIVFPGERDQSGNYFSVHLDAPTPEEVEQDDEQTVGAAGE